MKHITAFLFSLLVILVGALFAFKYIGITDPVTESVQSEELTALSESETAADQTESGTETEYVLPSYYNGADEGRVSKTRDQGELGACWAFAADTALESLLLPAEQWDFSEDHMIYNNGFGINAEEGGDYFMAVAYLASWKGPVTEEDDPYNDGMTNADAEVVKHLQEVLFLDECDADTIKKMIYEYGSVESSVYISIDDDQYIDETYYNKYNYSYCYDGDNDANHEIVIIGWDDNYSMDNFNTGAYADGAFICLNSWGTEFGNNGIFYVSYCDSSIAANAEVYTVLENSDNYDNIYQYDEHGWVGRMGFDQSSAFFANVYTAQNGELLRAVSFYATGKNSQYKVYVCENYNSEDSLYPNRELYCQGSLEYAGYYTLQLDEPVALSAGEKYAVVVEIDTPDSLHPVAVEMNSGDGRTGNVVTEGKESYISADGRSWVNTQQESECNVCLKAFTDNR